MAKKKPANATETPTAAPPTEAVSDQPSAASPPEESGAGIQESGEAASIEGDPNADYVRGPVAGSPAEDSSLQPPASNLPLDPDPLRLEGDPVDDAETAAPIEGDPNDEPTPPAYCVHPVEVRVPLGVTCGARPEGHVSYSINAHRFTPKQKETIRRLIVGARQTDEQKTAKGKRVGNLTDLVAYLIDVIGEQLPPNELHNAG